MIYILFVIAVLIAATFVAFLADALNKSNVELAATESELKVKREQVRMLRAGNNELVDVLPQVTHVYVDAGFRVIEITKERLIEIAGEEKVFFVVKNTGPESGGYLRDLGPMDVTVTLVAEENRDTSRGEEMGKIKPERNRRKQEVGRCSGLYAKETDVFVYGRFEDEETYPVGGGRV